MTTDEKVDLILQHLVLLDKKIDETCRHVTETQILVKRFARKCNEMLAACRDGYHNVLKAQEYCAEEVGDLSNCVSNIGWPA
jgi:hypothetical protein